MAVAALGVGRVERQAIRFSRNARFSVTPGGKLRLPKIGDIEVRWSRDLPAEPSSVTVIKDAAAGSANRNKARVRVARAHAKVADTRRDFHHKVSTAIIRDSQAVYVEDLRVAGLGRTRLAKSIHDAGWSAFTRMLAYKARRYGRVFAKVGRFEPTSQVCSACGVNDGPKPLSVRQWACAACGTVHNRDVNAARNVLRLGQVAAGRAETQNACRG